MTRARMYQGTSPLQAAACRAPRLHNEGHFYSFCCRKVEGKRKGHIDKATSDEEALRMVKSDEVKPEELSGFQVDRIRNIKTYVDVLTDPDFSYREGNIIVYGKKYDDIENGNGYLSVVLNVSDNTISPVSSSFKSLNKRTFEEKNIKWYYEKSLRNTSDASDATREGTSEGNSSRVHSNIAQDLENTSGNGGKSRFSVSIDTPEFKQWFKDSKVVDEDGKPNVWKSCKRVHRGAKRPPEGHPRASAQTRALKNSRAVRAPRLHNQSNLRQQVHRGAKRPQRSGKLSSSEPD